MKYGLKNKRTGKLDTRRFLTEREAERYGTMVLGWPKEEVVVLGTQKPPSALQHKMVSYWLHGKLSDGDPAGFINRGFGK